MSAQSITSIDRKYLKNKKDDFLIEQGLLFLNYYDYDVEPRPQYDKLKIIIEIDKIYDKKPCDTELLFNKIMK